MESKEYIPNDIVTIAESKGVNADLSDYEIVISELGSFLWNCELQKWLRDKHNILLCLSPSFGGTLVNNKQIGFCEIQDFTEV